MILYTLNENFQRQEIIDKYTSVIWTERYTKAGDVTLMLPFSKKAASDLREGTFLQTDGSDEIMLIETHGIEKGQLKVTGNTLAMFLNNRVMPTSVAIDGIHHFPETEEQFRNGSRSPGQLLSELVSSTCIVGGVYTTDIYGFDGLRQIIPGLTLEATLEAIELDGPLVSVPVPFGPIYDSLAQIAETFNIGFSLYLEHVTESGYSLKFKTYFGKDRTSEQSDNPLVRFSPVTDSLTDLKELRSIAGYKNVAYAYGSGYGDGDTGVPGVAYADSSAFSSVGFNRRVLVTIESDLTLEGVGGDDAVLIERLNLRAKNNLANNNYTRVVDGEIVPHSEYKYGIHYGLGDIVELHSPSGINQRARITEYIRSKDNTGEHAYPTVALPD